MAFLSGGNNTAQTVYTGLDIQTSALGVPIPLMWGIKRMGTNLIWMADFTAVRDKKGLGKGGEGKNPINEYTVAVIMALLEGPIEDIATVWQDKTITTLAALGLTLFPGTASQAVWAYLTSNHPTQALSYAYTAYVANSAYNLGRQPTLPNHNYEIIKNGGVIPLATAGWVDMNMGDIILDFLTNPQYSIGLPTSAIDAASLNVYQNYTNAQGLAFSPDITSQEQVSSIIDRWASLTNTWIFWSGNALKFVPLGDEVIDGGPGPFTQVDVSAIPLAPPISSGAYGFQAREGRAGYGITPVSVVFQDTGVTMTNAFSTSPPEGQYGIVAANYFFNAADAGRPIVVTYTRPYVVGGNSWVPNVLPLFNLTYDDFVTDKGTPPINVNRTDPADAYNHVKLEVIDRGNAYNTAVCEWKDQGLVDQFGLIDSPVTQAHEVCWPQIGNVCAQLIGQRAAYIRNTYEFKLGWEYGSVLEPGDIVTLTDSHIGITVFPVRLKTLDEDDQGNWAMIAEEFPGGIGASPGGSTATTIAPISTPINTGAAPGGINPPGVFEPAGTLTNGVPQLWVAASGGPHWGGCLVYISLDNVNYSELGAITTPAIQGVLTATLADHADPDTVNTIALDTTECDIPFPTDATHADADAFRTLSLVTPTFTTTCPNNGECLDYGAAATTGAFTANLSYLRRGLYGTAHASHASGGFFTRFNLSQAGQPIGNSVLIHNLPPQYVGVTIYLKFPSFNLFLGNAESLASVPVYTYTPSGAGFGGTGATGPGGTGGGGVTGGVPTVPTGLAAMAGIGQVVLSWNPNPPSDNVIGYPVYRATGTGASFGSATLIGESPGYTYLDSNLPANTGYTYFLKAANIVGDSAATAGVNATTSNTVGNLFRLSGNLAGPATASQILFEVPMVGGETFPAGLTNSDGGCDAAPAGSITCQLYQVTAGVATNIGSMLIAAGASGTNATFSFPSTITFANGDVMRFLAPAIVDATLANLYYTFMGTR